MNIDKVISSFVFDKFKSDCYLHGFLKTYMQKKSKLSSCDADEASILRAQLKDYSDILGQYLEKALCFPLGCKDCVGMQKCADCIKQEDLAETFIKLRKYL
ncbi:MAG: hypothetical protein OET63_07355 [Desulfobacterales bacterium]|nr:hypothetical protein [Desulfobacterales bacterium]